MSDKRLMRRINKWFCEANDYATTLEQLVDCNRLDRLARLVAEMRDIMMVMQIEEDKDGS